ncbi:MAG: SDR family NAD(P)-dependent oxidoreductase [Alphaproteobacteria bacterium]|nr:SDR family NAD(P)-dependent oxidoreductase [Alphaproteobacteria bacterium]
MTQEAHDRIAPAANGKKLFCFGFGYTAAWLALRLRDFGWKIAGTTTDPEKRDFMEAQGMEAMLYDQNRTIMDPYAAFEDVTHVLMSIPPGSEGDPVVDVHGEDLARAPKLEWAGYLSTTAVYGNHDGGWVDENTPPEPDSRRGSLRLRAEQQWLSCYVGDGLPLHIFRLSGIYGPGRSAVDSVRAGTARRIDKPGHAFNRIHVEDIVETLIASMNRPNPGAVYNVADDMPSSSQEVVTFACNLIGIDPPPLVKFDQAEMAPIVRSFYKDNKRVKNDRIKDELGVQLLYPDYHSGLQACLAALEQGRANPLFRASQGDVSGI